MKRIYNLLSLVLVMTLLCLSSCAFLSGGKGAWTDLRGNYAWDESAQYSNATLELMWLGDGDVLFEFDLMQGSEAEDSAMDLNIPGVLCVGEDGIGLYEAFAEDGTLVFSIRFALEDGGQKVNVTHEGELPISPDGVYSFIDGTVEMSDASARELICYLPSDTTKLDADTSTYTVQFPEGLIHDWFYPIDVVANNSGNILAKFLVAKDLSAVFRADEQTDAALIYGSAQPMMDAEFWESEDDFAEAVGGMVTLPNFDADAVAPDEEMEDAATEVVTIGLDGGTVLCPGDVRDFAVYLPWTLPYHIEAESADASIAVVSEGRVTAVGVGDTEIKGVLTIADGRKEFAIAVSVTDEVEGRGDLIE